MFVVASHDRYVPVPQTRAMYQAVKARSKRLEVLSGPFDGRHGWDLLTDPAGDSPPRSPPRSRRSSPLTATADSDPGVFL